MTRLLDWTNRHGKALAVRLRGVHPKHLVEVPGRRWWGRYVRGVTVDLGAGTGAHGRSVGAVTVDLRGRPDVLADARALPFRTGSIDTVLCFDMLEHVHEEQAVLAEIKRILTPAGRLILSVPNSETPWRARLRRAGLFAFSDPDHKREYTSADLTAALKRAGFVWLRMEPTVRDTPWAGMLDALGSLSLPLYRRIATWKQRCTLANSTGFCVLAVVL